VSWPGRISGGRRNDALVSEIDVFTTLLDVVGVESPPDRMGISFAPVLFGEAGPTRASVIGSMARLRPPAEVEAAGVNPSDGWVRSERAFFLRNSEWHYIWYARHERYPDRPPDALFRIDTDAFETKDVAVANPGLIARFREEIHRWRREVTTRTRDAVTAEARLRSESTDAAGSSTPVELEMVVMPEDAAKPEGADNDAVAPGGSDGVEGAAPPPRPDAL
jgi:arylsulfatase A-like enzyme